MGLAWLLTTVLSLPAEISPVTPECAALVVDPVSGAAACNEEGKARLSQAHEPGRKPGESKPHRRDVPGALAAFRLASALQPLHPEYVNNLAYVHEMAGHRAAAEHFYLQALALDPRRALARLNYAQFLMSLAGQGTPGRDEQHDLATAEGILALARTMPTADATTIDCLRVQIAARRDACADAVRFLAACRAAKARQVPKTAASAQASQRRDARPDFVVAIADCHFRNGDHGATQEALAEARSLGRDVRDRLAALEAARRQAQVDAGPERRAAVDAAGKDAVAALALLDAAKPKEAEVLLAGALLVAPDLGLVHAARAELFARQSQGPEAEAAWLRALALGLPDDARTVRAQAGLGRLYLRWPTGSRAAEAAVFLAEAVRRAPTRPDLRWDLVQAHRKAGHLRQAAAHLARLLQQPGDDPERRREALALQQALAAVVGEALADGATVDEPAPKPQPAPTDGARDRARKLAADDHYREAVAVLRQAARQHPSAALFNDLAIYLHALGDLPGTVQAWEASLRRQSQQPDIAERLGFLHLRLGQPDRARPWLRKAGDLPEASQHLLREAEPPPHAGPWSLLHDARARRELGLAIRRSQQWLQRFPSAPPPRRAEVQGRLDGLERRLAAVHALFVAISLILLAFLAVAAWRTWGGASLRDLVSRHPDVGPEVQRALAAIRHEVLKHNTLVLTGLIQAIESDDPAAPAKARHALQRLFGKGDANAEPAVADRLAGYVNELEQLGRGRGMRLNLRRRDPALAPLLAGLRMLKRLAPPLRRLSALGFRPRERLLAKLRQAGQLLHSDAYEAVRDLLDHLRLLRVDAPLLQGIFDRTRHEPGLNDATVAPLQLDVQLPLPVWILLPRPALEDIVANLVRNALQAGLRCQTAGEPVLVGLAVEVEVSAVTGIERLVLAVRDTSPEPFVTEQLRGLAIEKGLGLAAELVSRHDGTLDVRREAAPWTKAVVVKVPRAQPPEMQTET